jgi:hypothetical protein
MPKPFCPRKRQTAKLNGASAGMKATRQKGAFFSDYLAMGIIHP